jgi:hypothetical protein
LPALAAKSRCIRGEDDAKATVSDVMSTTLGYGFNLMNQHRAPLATFEYEDQETAIRMRRHFHEAQARATHVTVHKY